MFRFDGHPMLRVEGLAVFGCFCDRDRRCSGGLGCCLTGRLSRRLQARKALKDSERAREEGALWSRVSSLLAAFAGRALQAEAEVGGKVGTKLAPGSFLLFLSAFETALGFSP